jgi:two-component system, chemotaxis family, protein-glutamate methylesterase/glutaminase
MEPRDVVVIGGSAGCMEPLRALTAALPGDLPGSVLVTVHVGDARSELPWLLSRAGRLPASHAKEGERLRSGQIYVAHPIAICWCPAGWPS